MYICCILLLIINNVNAVPNFLNGRPRGGFMGMPKVLNADLLRDVPAQWFTQQLNHFNDAEQRTWQQRYYVNAQYFTTGGPVFLMIGGEGPLSSRWVLVGNMVEYAKQHGALILALEHRFYGESHPLPDMSTESLRYLSSEQALADLASFISAMNTQFTLTVENRWIAFGGSYPGALSAWLRYKYQHLVYGSIASSAPIQAQLDFPQYLEVSTDSLGTTQCKQNVQAASHKLKEYTSSEAGLKFLSTRFKTCKPLTGDLKDLQNFASAVVGNFFGVIQYNKDNREFEGAVGTNITIEVLCSIMNAAEDPLEGYAQVNDLMMRTYKQQCIDIAYQDYIDSMKKTDWKSSAAEGGRQWLYQTCTEFGYYQTTDSKLQVFGDMFPLSFSVKQCVDIFGAAFNETSINRGIDWTNDNYGGYGMNVKRLVFANGSIDPWHALSFISDQEDILAVYINGTAHCANMYPTSPQDSMELKEAREKIGDVITKWLQQKS